MLCLGPAPVIAAQVESSQAVLSLPEHLGKVRVSVWSRRYGGSCDLPRILSLDKIEGDTAEVAAPYLLAHDTERCEASVDRVGVDTPRSNDTGLMFMVPDPMLA